jgi:hypothetical protein
MNSATAMHMTCLQPKWPANWESAAFEAVAKKRSYVLSPPEIYAEIAHAGTLWPPLHVL